MEKTKEIKRMVEPKKLKGSKKSERARVIDNLLKTDEKNVTHLGKVENAKEAILKAKNIKDKQPKWLFELEKNNDELDYVGFAFVYKNKYEYDLYLRQTEKFLKEVYTLTGRIKSALILYKGYCVKSFIEKSGGAKLLECSRGGVEIIDCGVLTLFSSDVFKNIGKLALDYFNSVDFELTPLEAKLFKNMKKGNFCSNITLYFDSKGYNIKDSDLNKYNEYIEYEVTHCIEAITFSKIVLHVKGCCYDKPKRRYSIHNFNFNNYIQEDIQDLSAFKRQLIPSKERLERILKKEGVELG